MPLCIYVHDFFFSKNKSRPQGGRSQQHSQRLQQEPCLLGTSSRAGWGRGLPAPFQRPGGRGGGVVRLSVDGQITELLRFKKIFRVASLCCFHGSEDGRVSTKGQHSFWDRGRVGLAGVREGTSEPARRSLAFSQPSRGSGKQKTAKSFSEAGLEKPALLRTCKSSSLHTGVSSQSRPLAGMVGSFKSEQIHRSQNKGTGLGL